MCIGRLPSYPIFLFSHYIRKCRIVCLYYTDPEECSGFHGVSVYEIKVSAQHIFFRREMPIGKIEEVIANLRLGALSAGKKKNDIIADDRSFTEIVDQVMPKEVSRSSYSLFYS